jgi:hypothetical protein
MEEIMNSQSIPSFTAFVGLDWADRKHDFCLQAAGSDQREFGTMDHTPEVIAVAAFPAAIPRHCL